MFHVNRSRILNTYLNQQGIPIPVIDGVYLHSKFDPIGEAEEFARTCLEKSKPNRPLLIIGLGFGYHIRELLRLVPDLEIYVIEPEQDLISAKQNQDICQKVKVIQGKTPKEICNQMNFIQAIAKDAIVIKHKTSYDLNALLYQNIQSFIANKVDFEQESMTAQLIEESASNPDLLSQLNQIYALLEQGRHS